MDKYQEALDELVKYNNGNLMSNYRLHRLKILQELIDKQKETQIPKEERLNVLKELGAREVLDFLGEATSEFKFDGNEEWHDKAQEMYTKFYCDYNQFIDQADLEQPTKTLEELGWEEKPTGDISVCYAKNGSTVLIHPIGQIYTSGCILEEDLQAILNMMRENKDEQTQSNE